MINLMGFYLSFQSISGLKYHIQSGLDELEECRNFLLDQLLAIDKTMEKPKEEDILRVRFCQKCQVDGDGPLCVMCELDDLFQVCYRRAVVGFFYLNFFFSIKFCFRGLLCLDYLLPPEL